LYASWPTAFQIAALGKPIGVAFDLWTSNHQVAHSVIGIDGGRMYVITSQDKDGACHGVVVEFFPEGMHPFVEDSQQPKSVEKKADEQPAAAPQPQQPAPAVKAL
jgi:hypothetical protein